MPDPQTIEQHIERVLALCDAGGPIPCCGLDCEVGGCTHDIYPDCGHPGCRIRVFRSEEAWHYDGKLWCGDHLCEQWINPIRTDLPRFAMALRYLLAEFRYAKGYNVNAEFFDSGMIHVSSILNGEDEKPAEENTNAASVGT